MLSLFNFVWFIVRYYGIKRIKLIRIYCDNGEILEWSKD